VAPAAQVMLRPSRTKPNDRTGSIFFVGTATTIIRYAGFTILTDPNFLHQGDHVHLGYGLTSRRLTNPAIDIEDLPPIDTVVLSHLHEDHWDRLVDERLSRALPVVTTRKAAKTLKKRGFGESIGLKTWQTATFRKGNYTLHVTSVPGRHGGAIFGRLLPPVMGSILDWEGPGGTALLRMYITGDTLVFRKIKQIPRRYPDIDLAMLHLGGTRAFGVLVTMDGKQGVEAIKLIDPTIAVPIHYNDYSVFKSPLSDFQRRVRKAGLEHKVRYLSHGQTYTFEVPRSRTR
jgi:L-ascorbate metabolism protein UlaG (beta-lactamase superfamily)